MKTDCFFGKTAAENQQDANEKERWQAFSLGHFPDVVTMFSHCYHKFGVCNVNFLLNNW
jgi:hypothetical protein